MTTSGRARSVPIEDRPRGTLVQGNAPPDCDARGNANMAYVRWGSNSNWYIY